MSCGILMPKYVITALLTYFIQYKKLSWGWRNYVEKTVLSCLTHSLPQLFQIIGFRKHLLSLLSPEVMQEKFQNQLPKHFVFFHKENVRI